MVICWLMSKRGNGLNLAKNLLQMFPKYDKKQFANVATGDETWVHSFWALQKG